MRTGANVAPPTGGEEGSSAEFFEEIRKLLADFNVSIQEESKDRKLRFHVKPAHQVPSAAGRGCGTRSSTSTWMMMTVTLPACHTDT